MQGNQAGAVLLSCLLFFGFAVDPDQMTRVGSPGMDNSLVKVGRSDRSIGQREEGWINVTAGVGGEKWGYAGVCLLSAVPDRDEIIAGVSEAGLWSSTDGGKTWKKLGEGDREPIRNRPHNIIYDPKDSRSFWISGSYGAGIFRTIDAGRSFRRMGALNHVDGIAVDFTDPQRRTLLAGLHEQELSLQLSRDAGATWEKIGDRLPPDSNFSSDPIILDTKTFLVNAAGWRPKKPWGIYRSEDAGRTWKKVSDAGTSGRPLLAANGAIYWKTLWGGDLVKSADKGLTWKKLAGPAKGDLIEIPAGRLVGAADKQLYVSADGGEKWEKLGTLIPIKPSGVVYCVKRRAFYVWRSSDKQISDAIFRWDVSN